MAPLACLTLLNLRNNKIGDAGVESLAKACAGGALAQLTYLSIGSNQIGNAGVTALADACARGALAQLTTLHLEYKGLRQWGNGITHNDICGQPKPPSTQGGMSGAWH